jgi:hypothetical protein
MAGDGVVGGGAVVEDFGDYLREGLAGVDGDGVAGCQFVLDFGAPPVGPGGGVDGPRVFRTAV